MGAGQGVRRPRDGDVREWPAPAEGRLTRLRAEGARQGQGGGEHDRVDADGAGLDLRLLVPALAAWGVSVAVLPRGAGTAAVVAGLAGALALSVLVQAARRQGGAEDARRPGGSGKARRRGATEGAPGPGGLGMAGVAGVVRGQLALCGAAVALVTGTASLHLATASAGPVAGWAAERAVTEVRLVVTTQPRVVERTEGRPSLVVLEGRVVEATSRGVTTRPRTPVVVLATSGQGWEDVAWRSEVEAAGRWDLPDQPGRPVAVLTPRGRPVDVRAPPALLRGVDHVRARFRQAVEPVPADPRGLVPGLVIGDTSLTPPDLTQAMRDTGMTHLSAVSGSNVAIVVGGIALLASRCGLPRRWRLPVVLLGLAGFVLLCRPEPSVLRAGVMGVVGLLALTGGRRRASLPALAVAVLGLLCLDPWLARSYGFALSTLATLGLVLFARPWGIAMAGRLPRWADLPARAAAVPLAAQVVCAPVIVLLQGSITTVAVLANLLAAPLVAPTTILGVVAALVAPVWVPGATAVAWLAALPAWVIARVARLCARLPLGTVDWMDGPVGAWTLAGLTVALLLTGRWWWAQLVRRPLRSWAVIGAVIWTSALVWVPLPGLRSWPPPGWVVVGCDVGQGDAFVLRSGASSAVVVDTGPDPEAVSTCLRALDVQRVPLLVLTHFHADHIDGLEGVLRAARVDEALVSPVRQPADGAAEAISLLEQAGVPVTVAQPGDLGAVGEAQVRILGPSGRLATPDATEPQDDHLPGKGTHGGEEGGAANDASVVVHVTVRETRVLLVGDVESAGARALRVALDQRAGPAQPTASGAGGGAAGTGGMEAGPGVGEVDVLKVAHHGSADQDEALLHLLDPEVALIGVGADNTFGHPAPSTLGLLAQVGAVVLRTDLHGDVAVVRDERGRLATVTRDGR